MDVLIININGFAKTTGNNSLDKGQLNTINKTIYRYEVVTDQNKEGGKELLSIFKLTMKSLKLKRPTNLLIFLASLSN